MPNSLRFIWALFAGALALAVMCSGCTFARVETDDFKVFYGYFGTNKKATYETGNGGKFTFGSESDENIQAMSQIAESVAKGAVEGAK